jgi:hypothetical protein
MEYIDNRDWPEYNAQLVRIGEFYLDLSCVKNWSWELREMNRKKTGAPYKYPCTFITFASIIYSFLRLPYRQLEGFIGRLSTYEPGLVAADYTTLHKRISKQKLEIEIPGIKIRENAIVGKDASSRSTAVLEFKKWATRVGSKCISTVEDGRLKASSHRSSAFLVRRFGHLRVIQRERDIKRMIPGAVAQNYSLKCGK